MENILNDKPSWKIWVAWHAAKAGGIAFIMLSVSLGVQAAALKSIDWGEAKYDEFRRALTKVEIIREVAPIKSLPLPELIRQVSKEQGVPVVALQAIVDQESSGGKHLYNFEPNKFADLEKKAGKKGGDELRMLASSHGVAHVMGFNAESLCGIHWSRLYDEYEGLTCGAKILRKNIDRVDKSEDVGQRLWLAFKSYNGSGEAAENYANEVSSRVMKLLFKQLNKEVA